MEFFAILDVLLRSGSRTLVPAPQGFRGELGSSRSRAHRVKTASPPPRTVTIPRPISARRAKRIAGIRQTPQWLILDAWRHFA